MCYCASFVLLWLWLWMAKALPAVGYREVVRVHVDRPLLWRIMIVGPLSYFWLMVW
jgi:hypothetical protein